MITAKLARRDFDGTTLEGVVATDGTAKVWVPLAREFSYNRQLMVTVSKRRAKAMLQVELDYHHRRGAA